jgi:superfamily I DNA/RNA helicase
MIVSAPTELTADQRRPQEEAQQVVRAFTQLKGSGTPWKEMAVLYPKHVCANALEKALLEARVPYRRYGSTALADRSGPFSPCS